MAQSNLQETMRQTDPVTIVTLAREGLHDLPDSQKNGEAYVALEECINRFDQLQRAVQPAGWTTAGTPS